MLSTMQDVPLTTQRVLAHGMTVHGRSEVLTWTETGEPRRTTFLGTGRRANQLACALWDELDIRPADRVATLMWNNQEHLEAYLGVPSMGAVLHTLNFRLPAEQLTWIVRHAGDRVVIVDGSLVPLLAPLLADLPGVEHVVVCGPGDRTVLDAAHVRVHDYEDLIADRPHFYAWPTLDERDAAALCYTSGTTGDPKGVLYSHRSVYLHCLQVNSASAFALTDRDTVLPVVPMFHVNAWGLPHAAFMAGASLLMPDRFLQPGPLAAMTATLRPTIAAAVPTIWQGVLEHVDARPSDLSSLRCVVIGGAACPPSLMKDFEERHHLLVVQAWGMTETSPLGCIAHPPAGLGAEEEFAYRITQGRFPASVEARLTAPDGTVRPWDGRSPGELEVRGPWITGSYFDGIDAPPLRPGDSFTDDGWLRTGDLGTITRDGFLTLTDRLKDVIKSGGEWISSVDLENRLMAHPDVADAAVIGIPDTKWGERPLAAVVARHERVLSYADLRGFLAGQLAKWQLPQYWTQVEAVPRTSVGKLDKKMLRRRYEDGELDVTELS